MARASSSSSRKGGFIKKRTRTELRQENKKKFRIFFRRIAGHRPKNSSINTCSSHGIRRWRLCTGASTRSLINAGRWFALCHKCNFFRWGTPTLDFATLFAENKTFRGLYQERELLAPKSWEEEPDPLLQYIGQLSISDSSPGATTTVNPSISGAPQSSSFGQGLDLVFWVMNDAPPQIVKVAYQMGEAVALVDHQLLLEQCGIKDTGFYEVYDTATRSWAAVDWNTYMILDDEERVLLRLTSVSRFFDFQKFI
ncbi:hypothetical protein NP233_g6164 [Leucocoprinus birnbaumii]|uniref:Uncharacterized protein n=1 Tax=Leucocoprinus birnbaumii TaxID=56174 RepID=A0AAD5VU95_9AGAR|nr:hypothetical protein NP233_g6164 [Leucocoprinus birnbaumii]